MLDKNTKIWYNDIMIKIVLILLFLISISCQACDDVCKKKTIEAVRKHEEVKKVFKNIKKKLKLDEEKIRYLMFSKMIVDRKINTKYIKSLEFQYNNLNVNFNASWDIEEEDFAGMINFNWSF